ncbi:MAG: bifunctional precorrin-2 dehydrogenase/sirohydrochlorin ferrochelatase [Myxococcota bacterium]
MTDASDPHDVFPVFLKLRGKTVVIVGGGKMALEKLPALLDAGADVTVIAPEILPQVAAAKVTLRRREFRAGDLDAAWYVVAAAPPAVNREVSAEASRLRLFVNAVDDLKHADVYLGSVVRRSGFTFAISSNARSPALTALIRRGLEWLLPSSLDDWLSIAAQLRKEWKRDGIPFEKRRPLLLLAINAWHERRGEGVARQ